MENLLLLRNLLIALALGAFIGLEREYARYKKRGHDYAGIRTFPLIALFGALAAFFSDLVSPWIFFISILLMGVLILLAYVFSNKGKLPHIGATSEVAGFLTFFIGALSYYGEILLAIILTIAITIILYARSLLHQLAEHIQPKEMASVIKFLVITFIILPLLPNRWYGPYDIINPYLIWLMVVLISGIGFVGYIALKWFGEKALSVTGVLGGLASSTAVTMQFARRSKKEAALSRALATGVILANGVMFLRVLLVTAVVNLALFWSLFLPLAGLILLTAIFGYVLLQKMKKNNGKMQLQSPLTLKPAIQFALLFAGILALVKIASVFFAAKGIYVLSFLAGSVELDAIVLSLSQLAKNGILQETAQKGVLLAVVGQLLVKGSLAYWLGGKAFRKLVVSSFALMAALGILFIIIL
ncbi:MAG TPA: MgtC/SapB family protein [Candidatus Nanoarchaeia archaeon]|nr:MgtC/SapB family protein [Candidatus Nanoarchaeia archaeon]